MNQILYIQNNKKSGTIEIDRIILFFSIAIILFAISLLGEGIYGTIRNNDIQEMIENTIPLASLDKEGQQAKIHVSHIRPIKTVTYKWNDEEDTENTIDGNSRTVIIQRVDLPKGTNTLHVIITDYNGKIASYSKEFYSENGRDIAKPKIQIDNSGDYLIVTSTDDSELQYVTYRWNEEEETIVMPDVNDKKKIEFKTKVLKGENTFTVSAVDKSNNTTSRAETIVGVIKPTLEVYMVEGGSLYIIAKHDVGIKKIDFIINEEAFTVEGNGEKEITHIKQLNPGHNLVSITVTSIDGATIDFYGQADI